MTKQTQELFLIPKALTIATSKYITTIMTIRKVLIFSALAAPFSILAPPTYDETDETYDYSYETGFPSLSVLKILNSIRC